MSAIAAWFSRAAPVEPRAVDRLLGRMEHRGDCEAGRVHLGRVALGARRFEWEAAAGIAGASLAAQSGRVAVVADASLYYRDDLRRAIGDAALGDDPCALILAAYARWGDDLASRLEGDFAFVLFDEGRGVMLAARDHTGRRPLHYSSNADGVTVASLARAVAVQVGASFNLPAVAAAVGGLLGGSLETGFEHVFPVPAGATLAFSASGMRTARAWEAPPFIIGGRPRLREGAEGLRALLVDAVRERVVSPRTVVWLSGGADSTAVFAAGHADPELGRQLEAVSISYPEGDSAREDGYIASTVERWASPITWIDSESVDVFSSLRRRVDVRDDPYAHTFEAMNIRLATTSRQVGAVAAFDGYGGDQLFHVSAVFLADYLVRLRWRELRETMRTMEASGFKALVLRAVLPWLPNAAHEWIDRLRGRDPGRGTPTRQSLPSWMEPSWTADPGLTHRALLEPPRRLFESPAAYESRWYVESPYFPRAAAWSAGLVLEQGISIRSPLLDLRVLRYAASRPLAERVDSTDTKVVLKEAVRGLAPDSVLAPRSTKTGVPRGYLGRQLQRHLPGVFREVFQSGEPHLSQMGIVSQRALINAFDAWAASPIHVVGVQLYLTLQAELWLRSCAAARKAESE